MTVEETYLLIPDEFEVDALKLQDGCNVFNAVRTLDNRLVCSINSLNDFTERFEGVEVTVLRLTANDFPQYDFEGNRIN